MWLGPDSPRAWRAWVAYLLLLALLLSLLLELLLLRLCQYLSGLSAVFVVVGRCSGTGRLGSLLISLATLGLLVGQRELLVQIRFFRSLLSKIWHGRGGGVSLGWIFAVDEVLAQTLLLALLLVLSHQVHEATTADGGIIIGVSRRLSTGSRRGSFAQFGFPVVIPLLVSLLLRRHLDQQGRAVLSLLGRSGERGWQCRSSTPRGTQMLRRHEVGLMSLRFGLFGDKTDRGLISRDPEKACSSFSWIERSFRRALGWLRSANKEGCAVQNAGAL